MDYILQVCSHNNLDINNLPTLPTPTNTHKHIIFRPILKGENLSIQKVGILKKDFKKRKHAFDQKNSKIKKKDRKHAFDQEKNKIQEKKRTRQRPRKKVGNQDLDQAIMLSKKKKF